MDGLLYAFSFHAEEFKDSLDSFYEFASPLKNLIDEYYPSLSHYLCWGYISDEIGKKRVCDDIDTSDYNIIRSLDFISYFNIVNDDDLPYVILPIDIYDGAVSTVLVKHKNVLLSWLGLKTPIQLYYACPLLIELLRSAVEYNMRLKHSGFSTSLENNRYIFYKYIILTEVVTRTLKAYSLPYISFFHSIANSYYEGNENIGVIEFFKKMKGQPDAVEFLNHNSLDSTDKKLLRKLLEMTNSNDKLLVSKRTVNDNYIPNSVAQWQLFGIGIADSNPVARVEFHGISKWDLYVGEEIASYTGESFIIRNRLAHFDETETEKIEQFFKKYDSWAERYNKLSYILKALKKQQHGTMVVVCENAEYEAERLCNANRGIRIVPFDFSKLSEERIIKLSSIDGAILLDQDATCYALGIILDGYIDKEFVGDSGRGARYNSAKLYIHNIKQKKKDFESSQTVGDAMAIVLSEDKYLNVFSTIEDEPTKD